MKNLTAFILIILLLVSCNRPAHELSVSESVKNECARWQTLPCEECTNRDSGVYKFCYYDSKRYKDIQVIIRDRCHGIHVGNRCKPCERIFALNFGAALTEVSCEEFFTSLEQKEADCDDCIRVMEINE
mgnify:CR=1 FL=1